jgi:hypothetical protein
MYFKQTKHWNKASRNETRFRFDAGFSHGAFDSLRRVDSFSAVSVGDFLLASALVTSLLVFCWTANAPGMSQKSEPHWSRSILPLKLSNRRPAMKTIAALIAGVLLSVMTFVAGLLIALFYVDGGEVQHRAAGLDSAVLWTSEPVKVDRNPASFERLAARPAPEETKVANIKADPKRIAAGGTSGTAASFDAAADNSQAMIDPVTTGAIDPDPAEGEADLQTPQNIAHIEWCSRRYRSYRADDNTYKPYGGRRRPCESPYAGVTTADVEQVPDINGARTSGQPFQNTTHLNEDDAALEQASFDEAPGAYVSEDHMRSCMQRYRSYRPEDNTYQPYDGGPRRQCR